MFSLSILEIFGFRTEILEYKFNLQGLKGSMWGFSSGT